jgi:hypothetical protein
MPVPEFNFVNQDDINSYRRRRIRRVRYAVAFIAVAVVVALLILATSAFAASPPTSSGGAGLYPANPPTLLQDCLKKSGTGTAKVPINLGDTTGFAQFSRTWSDRVALCGRLRGTTFERLRILEINGRLERFNQSNHKWMPVAGSHFYICDHKDVGRHEVRFAFAKDWHLAKPGTYRAKFHVELRTASHAAQLYSWAALIVL